MQKIIHKSVLICQENILLNESLSATYNSLQGTRIRSCHTWFVVHFLKLSHTTFTQVNYKIFKRKDLAGTIKTDLKTIHNYKENNKNIINGSLLRWKNAQSSFPRGSVLNQMLLSIFTYSLNKGIKSAPMKSTDSIKLGETASKEAESEF